MSILRFVMFLLPVVIYFHISNKLVVAIWPRTILANIFLVSHILQLFRKQPSKSQNLRSSENIYHIALEAVR